MAVAVLEPTMEDVSLLGGLRSDLLGFVQQFESSYLTLSPQEAAAALVEVEQLSKLVDHLQTVAARAAEDHQLATTDALDPYKNTAEYLRAKIGISRTEANRRLRLGHDVLPELPGPGAALTPPLGVLAEATSAGALSSRAATIIRNAVHRVSPAATRPELDAMEEHLVRQAVESDEDVLRALAQRWEDIIDQDGTEPTDKILRARQGVFLRGRRHGLHFMEIGATDEQYEHLITVMNTATNPRAQNTAHKGTGTTDGKLTNGGDNDAGSSPDEPTREQSLLDGLVSACRIALAGDGLPATGGHRPQVMVTINYRDLLNDMSDLADRGHDGHSVFAQQLSARSIRKLACDAGILPLILGGEGQVLDIGRTQRLFPPHLRRALVARDKGCAFPDCTTPATWCEAHHTIPWATGGTTTINHGVLLCSWHHHQIHQGNWTVESINGIPWFTPPKYLDPHQTPKRNRYWQVEQAIHNHLARSNTGTDSNTHASTHTHTGTGERAAPP
ncbi:HNH endonuclease signature motif containing protein [Arthrobacter tumbae]|uniref:HNH endonuclease signature motif containing protein n=1 Tax=Arthrobacter tumbae TaxID=163874 RepID=UPI001EF7DC0F|nr:HNH endonuclease signature motif containing protein [Arthrobacter tumbae]MBM7780208.1 hypothetical protein [Arthrobacter tumbae]